ncbi:MerR family transcriptional regulator [Nocardiopsis ansamitocini]|uniref:MerR family transcriptional regulator n=1 Tax=Nocardiopsis ansamitocini TaxID=1670832 RepID=A0A9W6UK65_9ACTN|nr:MerR family transcriptional regulator [Nocardiopsis ansamitocini]GLU49248.1 MerR family transcriptional regulator [Nocardiopsis ansamitocini]
MAAHNGGQTWKVGEVSRLTGLTVRTLHHYEHVGVLVPSARTESGHRLYNCTDVQRLYQVVALRDLGLDLGTVATVLAGELDITVVLGEHLDHVERRLTALMSLRSRLAALLAATRSAGTPGPIELLALTEEVIRMEETTKRYFSPEQLAALETRREQVGEQLVTEVQAEWPRLIAEVRTELDAGTPAASPRVQALAKRWMELLEAFHGGDPGLRDSLYRMQAENSEEIRQQYGGPTPELIAYVQEAVEAS